MKKLVLPLALLVFAVARSDGFAGWISQWHARVGARALARAQRDPGDAASLERAVRELAAAASRNPASVHHRRELDAAVGEAIGRLGPAATAELAPPETLPRAVFANLLASHGAKPMADLLLATTPRTTPTEVELLTDVNLFELALAVARANRCGEAVPLLEAARSRIVDPRYLDIDYARCLTATGRAREGLSILLEVERRDPNSKWLGFCLGEAYLALGELQAADAVTLRVVQGSPDFDFGWRIRGDVLEAMKKTEGALRCYRRAQALDPSNNWLRWRVGQLETAVRDGSRGG